MKPDAGDSDRRLVAGNCTGCGACIPACPVHALSLESDQGDGRGHKRAVVALPLCTFCGACLPACPRGALTIASES